MLVTPDVQGVSLTTYRTIDGRKAANCTFDAAPVVLLASDAATAIDGILEGAILALSAEAVGAMNALVDMTASYAERGSSSGYRSPRSRRWRTALPT